MDCNSGHICNFKKLEIEMVISWINSLNTELTVLAIILKCDSGR